MWTAFGALAFAVDIGLHATVDANPWLHRHEWLIGGAVLVLAGAFQFTKLKDACLDRCRHPTAFLLRYYERGIGGGLRLGIRHGGFCVGCCWALMLVMFAVGVASLLWMAVLTALMVYEKTRPARRPRRSGYRCRSAGGRVARASVLCARRRRARLMLPGPRRRGVSHSLAA